MIHQRRHGARGAGVHLRGGRDAAQPRRRTFSTQVAMTGHRTASLIEIMNGAIVGGAGGHRRVLWA